MSHCQYIRDVFDATISIRRFDNYDFHILIVEQYLTVHLKGCIQVTHHIYFFLQLYVMQQKREA